MTTDQAISEINRNFKKLSKSFGGIVSDVHAKQVPRIFVDGERANGSKIGQYDTKQPLYVNPQRSPKGFNPKGKPGANTNIPDRKTRWFANYKSFKKQIGRESNFVNLTLANDLVSDYRASLTRLSPFRFVVGVQRQSNLGKINGLIKKYGSDIFNNSKEEIDFLIERINKERIKLGV